MISSHCGVRLVRLTPDYPLQQTLYHRWKCVCCGKKFSQRRRQPAKRK